MRYYFHLRSENEIIPDSDGIEIDHSSNVRSAVLNALAEISGHIPGVLDHLNDWKLSVCTSLEEVVFSIPLGEVSVAQAERRLIGSVDLQDWCSDPAEVDSLHAA
jgi:hypothetical protein